MTRASSGRESVARFLVEGFVIVISILLAFAVDAAWDQAQERQNEREALRLLVRDLTDAVDRLTEYVAVTEGYRTSAALAYKALSSPEGIDEAATSDLLARSWSRRTLRVPTAAYSDLVSTGTLRIIRDRGLRDEIVRFYELMDRSQDIIEKNSAVFIDQQLTEWIDGEGLFVPRYVASEHDLPSTRVAHEQVDAILGPDFEHPRDRLWSLPPDSREWHGLRNTLHQWTRGATVSILLAGQAREEALDLRERIESSLEGRGS